MPPKQADANRENTRDMQVKIVTSVNDAFKTDHPRAVKPVSVDNRVVTEQSPPKAEDTFKCRFADPYNAMDHVRYFSENVYSEWHQRITLRPYIVSVLSWRRVPENARPTVVSMFERMKDASVHLLQQPDKKTLLEEHAPPAWDGLTKLSKHDRRVAYMNAFKHYFAEAKREDGSDWTEDQLFPNASSARPSLFKTLSHLDSLKSVFTVFTKPDNKVDDIHPLCMPGPADPQQPAKPSFGSGTWSENQVQTIVDCLNNIAQNTKKYNAKNLKKKDAAPRNAPVQADANNNTNTEEIRHLQLLQRLNLATEIRNAVFVARVMAGKDLEMKAKSVFHARRRHREGDSAQDKKTPKKKSPQKSPDQKNSRSTQKNRKQQQQQQHEQSSDDDFFDEEKFYDEQNDAIDEVAVGFIKRDHPQFAYTAALLGFDLNQVTTVAHFLQVADHVTTVAAEELQKMVGEAEGEEEDQEDDQDDN